jgi:uncharacterized protein YyaL (SSP411 family)
VAALALFKIGRMTMDTRFTEEAEQVLKAFSGQLQQSPTSLSAMLIALDFSIGPAREIVIVADASRPDTKEMLKLIHSKFLPNTVVLLHQTGKDGEAIEKIAPFVKFQVAINDKATAYVCENYVCKQPVTETDLLRNLLENANDGQKVE